MTRCGVGGWPSFDFACATAKWLPNFPSVGKLGTTDFDPAAKAPHGSGEISWWLRKGAPLPKGNGAV